MQIVDALRAVAALYVMFGHTDLSFAHDTRWWTIVGPLWRSGGTGVSLFLVLSGFAIHLRWAARADGRSGFPIGRFWRRRFVRLYPTYWAALALSAAILFALHGSQLAARDRSFFWGDAKQGVVVLVVNHVLVVGTNVVPAPFFARAWSLALEEHIYAAYSVMMRFVRRLRPLRLLAAAFAMCIAWQVGAQAVGDWVPLAAIDSGAPMPAWQFAVLTQAPARAFEWVLGLVIADLWARGRLPSTRSWARAAVAVAALLLVAALVVREVGWPGFALRGHVFHPSDVILTPLFGVGYAVLLTAGLAYEADRRARALPSRWLATLAAAGAFSYSLYLLHPPLLEAVATWAPGPASARVVAGWCTAVGCSWAFYRVAERPFVARSAAIGRVAPPSGESGCASVGKRVGDGCVTARTMFSTAMAGASSGSASRSKWRRTGWPNWLS